MTTKHQTADLIPTYNYATFRHNSNVFHLKALSVCKKTNKQTSKPTPTACNVSTFCFQWCPKMIGNWYETRSIIWTFRPGLVLWFCIIFSIVKLFSCSNLLSEQVLFSSRLLLLFFVIILCFRLQPQKICARFFL